MVMTIYLKSRITYYFCKEIKADGLIIQDLAVAKIHREMGLTIPMHASVQMGIGSSSAVNFLESLGFSRVILSKNLNLQEIEDITAIAT